ncbi:MAG: hotdog family protein [Aliivibrio sp.]|uniref:ApeP family dehydratase n=1 Tax=Aliivibrio sp. TaxID=1872443 RepID=UPI001A38D043|nr:hotdog family protein [Aliivibrio sp.]
MSSNPQYPAILDLLPHDMPMALINHLVNVTDKSVQCQVIIDSSSLFYRKESGTIPGWVGIEYMAQTIAAWSGYHALQAGRASPIGFLLGSRKYESHCPEFTDGMVLNVFGEQILENEGMAVFSCKIEHESRLLAFSQLNVFVPTEEKLEQLLAGQK